MFLLITSRAAAQFYLEVQELKPYFKELGRIDNLIHLDPVKAKEEHAKLLAISKSKKDKTLETVLDIYSGTILYYTGKNDSATVFFESAIRKADKLGNRRLHSTASIRRLFVIDRSADAKIMLQFMSEEHEKARLNKDTLNMIYSLNGMAMYNERLDSTKRCIDLYLQAIRLAREHNNLFEYGFLLNNLGLLKLRMKAPEEAYADFNKGIKIAKSLENTRLELTLRENLGYYYTEVDSIDLAEAEYRSTLALAESKNYTLLAFNSLVNLGVLERVKGNISRSDSLLNSALKTAMHSKLYYAVSPIFMTMAQIALENKEYTKLNSLLDSAMRYSGYTSANEIQEAYYQLKHEEFTAKGNFKEALDYYKRLTGFRDSLDRSGHAQIMKELQLKYDVEKEEKRRIQEKNKYRIKLARKERDNAVLKQNIGIGVILFILALAAYIIYSFRKTQKKEREFSEAIVNKLEEERGRIARDLHDGLGQGLVILKNKFNKMSVEDPDNEQITQINSSFTDVIEEVRSISRSLIPPELRRLGLKKAIYKMMKDIEDASLIIVTSDLDALDKVQLEASQEIRIYRIIQELTNNTMKHSGASSLKLELEVNRDSLVFTYQDNGKGFDAGETSQSESLGLRSIEQRLRYLHGSIRYEKQSKGFKAIVKIKLNER